MPADEVKPARHEGRRQRRLDIDLGAGTIPVSTAGDRDIQRRADEQRSENADAADRAADRSTSSAAVETASKPM